MQKAQIEKASSSHRVASEDHQAVVEHDGVVRILSAVSVARAVQRFFEPRKNTQSERLHLPAATKGAELNRQRREVRLQRTSMPCPRREGARGDVNAGRDEGRAVGSFGLVGDGPDAVPESSGCSSSGG